MSPPAPSQRDHRLASRGRRVGAILAVGLALDGCAVGPRFTKPEAPITESWQTQGDPHLSTQTAADSLWWKAFNDPALDRLIELANRQNLTLQIAGLRILEARAQLGVVTGRQYPQFQVATGNARAVGVSENGANSSGLDRHYFDYQLGFDAAWELDFWGKYRRGVEAEAAALLQSVADYSSALVSLDAEVARTYVVMRAFEVLIEQAKENARIQEDGLRIAESRFRNGATSELDPAQATTLLESTRASIPQLQIGLQQARNALSTLLGQPAGTIDDLLAGPRAIPTPPETVAVSVPAEMLRRRPDIRSAELAAAAQCARIGVAQAELYPSFSLLGTLGFGGSNSGGTFANPFLPANIFYSIGPRIAWPFFNYGRLRNGVRVEDARFEQSLVGYRDTVLKAIQEVEDALTGYLHSREAMAFELASVTAAQRAVSIAVVQYREGAVDFQRVLDAERSLLQQQTSLTQTNQSLMTNLIALYKALGGGWESQQGQPLIPDQTRREMEQRTDWGHLLSQPGPPEHPQPPTPAKQ